MNKLLPEAKLDNIVVQNLKDETLIYNLNTNQAFCLNETAAKVFDACDGETTLAELKDRHRFTDEIVYLALDGLRKENLIASEYVSPFAGMNRREVIRRVGLASIVTLPVISTLIAPQALHAASVCTTATSGRGLNCPCTDTSQCQPPANRCCIISPPASLNGTCQSGGVVGNGGVCGNTCTCISNCCAGGICVAPGSTASGSPCSVGCQCSSGTCNSITNRCT